jgi:hypothetical protein
MKRLTTVTAVLCAVFASSAFGASISQPASGASVAQGSTLFFDWAWESDEYATSSIVFTHAADPSDPVWTWQAGTPATVPGQRVVVSDHGYPFLDSHATVTFSPSIYLSTGQVYGGFDATAWYWRLCNKSIYGEDDKCAYDTGVAPRLVNVTPGATCYDGLDNDGDGRVDLVDPGCSGASDTDETDPPPPVPVAAPAAKAVTLTLAQSRSAVRAKIRAMWGTYAAKRVQEWDCYRLTTTTVHCNVIFNARRTQFGVSYDVRRSADVITAKRVGKVKRHRLRRATDF